MSWKVLLTARATSSIELIIMWILYFSASKFVKSKCQKVDTPRMFGNFQRNIVTFFQTLVYFTIQSLYQIFQKTYTSIQMENQKTVHLYLDLVFILILPLILQLVLIRNLYRTMPMLFYDFSASQERMKPRSSNIVPRIINNLVHQKSSRIVYLNNVNGPSKHNCPITSYHKSKIIFVKPKKNLD